MYQRILVPVDGSAFSEEVIPYAQALAAPIGAAVELVCASDAGLGGEKARQYLDALASRAGVTGIVIDAAGEPAVAIRREAHRLPGTLIAIAARGRSGFGTAVLGSTARSLVQASDEPVLVYRPSGHGARRDDAPHPITTVVLPLDGGERSEAVRTLAAEWAKALGAELVVVQAVDAAASAAAMLDRFGLSEDGFVRARARDIEHDYGVATSWEVLHGDPAEALADFVAGRDDVLVVMATRRQPALRAAVLGSVTSGFMHRASVPVVIRAVSDDSMAHD